VHAALGSHLAAQLGVAAMRQPAWFEPAADHPGHNQSTTAVMETETAAMMAPGQPRYKYALSPRVLLHMLRLCAVETAPVTHAPDGTVVDAMAQLRSCGEA
jgi:hypothetical protein